MLLEIKNISKKYSCKKTGKIYNVLKNVSLKVEIGEKIAITGVSGSGKSTLLYILGTLDKPDEGSYFWGQLNVLQLSLFEKAVFRKNNIGFVFQNYHLLPNYSVFENIQAALRYSQFSTQERKSIIEQVLEEIGLTAKINNFPRELSGGEAQRISLARALVNKPSLILADEPTGNLDAKNSEVVLSLFEKFHKQGKTIIIVTHNPFVVEFCDRRYVLENGELQKI